MSPLFVALVTLVIATATPTSSEKTPVGLESRDVANNPSNQLCCVQQSERPRTFADWTIENDVRDIV